MDATPPVRHTVPPGRSTLILWQAAPDAECYLIEQNAADYHSGLRLFADHSGVVRFYALPTIGCDDLGRMAIVCNAGGLTTRHPFEFRLNHQCNADFPFPPRENAAVRPKGAVRPALTEEEATRLSDEEIRGRGYPSRPDPEAAPGAFLTWRRMVLTPMTLVSTRTVPRPEIIRQRRKARGVAAPLPLDRIVKQVTYPNWSGFELLGTQSSFVTVQGQWQVSPLTAGFAPTEPTATTVWVGLDGIDGLADLVQAGTYQQCQPSSIAGLVYYSYFAWTLILPLQKGLQQCTNFDVLAGDEVWVALTTNWDGGASVFFELSNLTRGTVCQFAMPKGRLLVPGTEAEWIVERPQFLPPMMGYFDLADYGSTVISNAYVLRADKNGLVPFQGTDEPGHNVFLEQITMVNEGRTLSTVDPIDASSMRFTWKGYR
jgi:hypothetical protein